MCKTEPSVAVLCDPSIWIKVSVHYYRSLFSLQTVYLEQYKAEVRNTISFPIDFPTAVIQHLVLEERKKKKTGNNFLSSSLKTSNTFPVRLSQKVPPQ